MHQENSGQAAKKEESINYPEEFLALAGQIFNDELHKLSELLRAIQDCDDTLVRILIEEKMDSYNWNPVGPLTDAGADTVIINLVRYSETNRLYSQYMQLFEDLDDKNHEKR